MTKTEIDFVEPVKDQPAQVNLDIPVAVPTTQRKLVGNNRSNLFLPDIPKESTKTLEPEILSYFHPASTDQHDVGRKRKLLPSSSQMDRAYQWLTSFSMEKRIHGRCKPAKEGKKRCRFLTGWLPNDLRQEFEEKADLRWRDWNFCVENLRVEAREFSYLRLSLKPDCD